MFYWWRTYMFYFSVWSEFTCEESSKMVSRHDYSFVTSNVCHWAQSIKYLKSVKSRCQTIYGHYQIIWYLTHVHSSSSKTQTETHMCVYIYTSHMHAHMHACTHKACIPTTTVHTHPHTNLGSTDSRDSVHTKDSKISLLQCREEIWVLGRVNETYQGAVFLEKRNLFRWGSSHFGNDIWGVHDVK